MLCPSCNQPMKAAISRERLPVWACVPCQQSLPRKEEHKQWKLPGLDPGVQAVNVQEQNKAKRRKGEHLMQCTLFDQIRKHETAYPILHCVYAVPNGGFRPINVAKEMVREGVRKGVPDIVVAAVRRGYPGLYIEMKMKDGVVSEHQKWWHAHLKSEGYRCVICRSWEDAWGEILWYLNLSVGMNRRGKLIREATPEKAKAA